MILFSLCVCATGFKHYKGIENAGERQEIKDEGNKEKEERA
jgi:hypothetical protein